MVILENVSALLGLVYENVSRALYDL